MNLLELQVRIVISGVPESGRGPTLLDWPLPLTSLSAAPLTLPPRAQQAETQS
jgi:hypothetical protein